MKETEHAPSQPVRRMAEWNRIIVRIDRNMERFTAENTPSFTINGRYTERHEPFHRMDQWTHSFFTGMTLQAFQATGDPRYLRYIYSLQEDYRRKVTADALETMHDLGFLYSLSETALYRTTGDREARAIGLLAATELAKRLNVQGRYIDAWSRMDRTDEEKSGLMIIDCMMNLPLLFWAWTETKHRFFRDAAAVHADTTLERLVRDDFSVCHAFQFDPLTGEPLGERNYCGYGVGTAWARGTAWALYGFAVAFRYTGKRKYLEAAEGIARYYASQLPPDCVPVWDFRLPPGGPQLVDTSAAAISACGLLELAELEGAQEPARWRDLAERMIRSLSRPPYQAEEEEESILRLAQCGDLQAGAIWGDYFYMEALLRLEGRAGIFW
ncbi:glycoside hydrolase family 88 protein [Paenibacillus sp. YN15]|uniref:glycoside hydrolase family 88 protein n=1 Tax=Paenibacillus sp. YN15 TaxID=1742774 RepID=UPI0015EB2D1E|nr:glycoside hydrolase family 88 protein [Paenibacillus sp. YN15]